MAGAATGGVQRTFADEALQEQFAARGFVVVPMVEPDALAGFRAAVEPLIPVEAPGEVLGDSFDSLFALYHHDHRELRYEIDRAVRPLLAEQLADLMPDQRIFIASLLVKYPGSGGYLQLHQDWSFVDETRFGSGIVWLALEPTDSTNGGLYAVPGSHLLDVPFRGIHPNTPPVAAVEQELRDRYLEDIPAPAGSAVIFLNRLIHGSNANMSDHPRISLALGFAPAEADLVHFVVDENGDKWRHTVTDSFFFDYTPGTPPTDGVVRTERWDARHAVLESGDLAVLDGARAGGAASPGTRRRLRLPVRARARRSASR